MAYTYQDILTGLKDLNPDQSKTNVTGAGGGSSSGSPSGAGDPFAPLMNQLSQTSNLLANMLQPLAKDLADTAVYKLGRMPNAGDVKIAKLIGRNLKYKSGMLVNYAKSMAYKSAAGDQTATASLGKIFEELDSLNTKQDALSLGLEKLADGRTPNVERKNIMAAMTNYYGDIYGTQKAQAYTGSLASLAQIGQLGTALATSVGALQASGYGGGGGSKSSYGGVSVEETDPLTYWTKLTGSAAETLGALTDSYNRLPDPEKKGMKGQNIMKAIQYTQETMYNPFLGQINALTEGNENNLKYDKEL